MILADFSRNSGNFWLETLGQALSEETEMEWDKFGAIQEIADDAVRLATIAEKQIEALQAQRASFDHCDDARRVPGYSRCCASSDEREGPTVRHRTFRHAVKATESYRVLAS